ncbi:MAG: efflux RND transporter periplasmic adaptor subunit [Desulfobacteraceae bacterium]|nr:efflux RND transporter periplasmic adaptor subunit [Desulfobacteraceae bacterium]
MSEPSQNRGTILRQAAKGLGVLILLIGMMMWLAGAFVRKVESGPPEAKPHPGKLNTLKVERRVYPLVIDQVGSLRAQNEAMVSSRIMAQVKEILVREGDKVVGIDEDDKPTVMARLDDRDIQAKLRQAQSQSMAMDRAVEVARAKLAAAMTQVESTRASKKKDLSDYHRYQDLKRNQAATGQQLEHARAQKDIAEARADAALQEVQAAQGEIARAQAQKEQAEAAIAEARTMLSYTVIQAPFTGQVVRKMINVGDMASPGQSLFFLETPAHPELHAALSESLIQYLKTGQDLQVHIDALNLTLEGKIREIVPQSDPSTRTVLVKVSLPAEQRLVNGLFGRLRIPYSQYDALVIPSKAVSEVGQLPMVEVIDMDGYPQRRFVTLGESHGDLIEVLSGLNENEEAIIP